MLGMQCGGCEFHYPSIKYSYNRVCRDSIADVSLLAQDKDSHPSLLSATTSRPHYPTPAAPPRRHGLRLMRKSRETVTVSHNIFAGPKLVCVMSNLKSKVLSHTRNYIMRCMCCISYLPPCQIEPLPCTINCNKIMLITYLLVCGYMIVAYIYKRHTSDYRTICSRTNCGLSYLRPRKIQIGQ